METWTPQDLQAKLDEGSNVFVKLWKPGCGACKLSISATDRMETQNTYGLEFGQINVEDFPEMLEMSDTDVVPAFFVFRNCKLAGSFVGFKGLAKLDEMLTTAFTP